ncbi:hypothetical protein BJ917_3314 [Pseudomonas sp. WPR_5_2]|uniref:Uncharacterized protein n=1 Tax=Pseudomonas izuensis TaxID=2684212 RepID=A0ABM7RHU3_9PSED|nr:hypothetical protein BJ917_3314 [Pseudomonas sp. WPR_5_2]BCX65824.1 hypothetical protein LAB08_R04290 [Pseudomonas izuensis]
MTDFLAARLDLEGHGIYLKCQAVRRSHKEKR